MNLFKKLLLSLVALATLSLATPAQAGWYWRHHHRYYRPGVAFVGHYHHHYHHWR